MEVYIVGYGGNSKIVADICNLNNYKILGYFDDCQKGPDIVGTISDITEYPGIQIINSIGDVDTKRYIDSFLNNTNINWINCIHPNSYIAPSVKIGYGNIICYGAMINSDTKIGNHNLINTYAIIEHDSMIGNFNHIAPRTTICGNVSIGDNNLIGAGTTIIPSRLLGDNNIVGAMTVIIENFSDNSTIVGNPGKKIKAKNMYKSKWPFFTEKMIENVSDVLKSGKVNQWTGTKVTTFQDRFSEYFGVKYSIAVANGSLALELCLKAINLKSNDEVIVTPRSFIASASCVSICGGTPVFVDVDADSQNITLNQIKQAVTSKTTAVILVHLSGWPCDLEEIVDWCHERDICVIEDCAQATGAKYKDKYIGTFGDINAWSFCQDKIMTTGGEGGMVTTNSDVLFRNAWSYKDHGKNLDKIKDKMPNNYSFKWVHDTIGTNWRMTEMQASIGIDSLEELDSWVKIRRNNASILTEYLSDIPMIRTPTPGQNYYHSYYKYYCFIDPGYQEHRDNIIKELNRLDVPCFQGTCGEIYLEKAFGTDWKLNATKKLSNTSLMFLVDPSYDIDRMKSMAETIRKSLIKYV